MLLPALKPLGSAIVKETDNSFRIANCGNPHYFKVSSEQNEVCVTLERQALVPQRDANIGATPLCSLRACLRPPTVQANDVIYTASM
jgi:hypothetical protein